MRKFFGRKDPSPVDNHIKKLLSEMESADVNSEEYEELLSLLERLYALNAKEHRTHISGDTILVVAGNLVGILMIIAYEQKHVLQSKGLGQLIRPKTP